MEGEGWRLGDCVSEYKWLNSTINVIMLQIMT